MFLLSGCANCFLERWLQCFCFVGAPIILLSTHPLTIVLAPSPMSACHHFYFRINTHTYTHTYIHTHTHTYTHTYTHIYAHAYTHTHTHTYDSGLGSPTHLPHSLARLVLTLLANNWNRLLAKNWNRLGCVSPAFVHGLRPRVTASSCARGPSAFFWGG